MRRYDRGFLARVRRRYHMEKALLASQLDLADKDVELADERANTDRERQQKEYYRRKCDELMATINEQARIASFIASGHDSATTTTPATPPALPSGTSASTPSTRRRSPTRKRKPPTPRGS